MRFDFTIYAYMKLLKALSNQGFSFLPFEDFIKQPTGKSICLRHDVDKLPLNSLAFAKIQADFGIRGTYYFRIVPESFNEAVIIEIAQLGHEVGYHYEDISTTANLRQYNTAGSINEIEIELVKLSIESFSKSLERFRKIVPVKTICMHGSPLSRWDPRLLWKYYDYRDFGIVGEPYFDTDFNKVLYLTDTGRRWNGDSVSIRDKPVSNRLPKLIGAATGEGPFTDWKVMPISFRWNESSSPENLLLPCRNKLQSTSDIIREVNNECLPDKIMMTFHPQRWTDKSLPWAQELLWQNVKNVAKYIITRVAKRELYIA